jgi:hypothetical protein
MSGLKVVDKVHGGPDDNPFQHACEAEQSVSKALVPELCRHDDATDTNVKGYPPPGHIDCGGDIHRSLIPVTAMQGRTASSVSIPMVTRCFRLDQAKEAFKSSASRTPSRFSSRSSPSADVSLGLERAPWMKPPGNPGNPRRNIRKQTG